MADDRGRAGIRGRGAGENPQNRFDLRSMSRDEEARPEDFPDTRTQFLPDTSKSAITFNDSPDIGFSAGLNPYRGCEHGCSYCYARPSHEYLGLSAGIDFETKIFFKADAPALLRKELSSSKWEPQPISMSGITDCYQPIERKFGITRACLEVLAEFRNPVGIITKNFLVTRDIDFLAELARYRAVSVAVSITTLDADLAGRLEPRASRPERRLEAIRRLHEAGVYVGVNVAPVIPGLNDHEIPAILDAAARAGARFAGHSMLQLPWAVKDLFPQWLEAHEPLKKGKILHRIREMRGGKLNDPIFFDRMRGKGFFAEQIHALFRLAKKKAGIPSGFVKLSTKFFRRPGGRQLTMFGE